MEILIILILGLIVINYAVKDKKENKRDIIENCSMPEPENQSASCETPEDITEINYQKAYQARYLLTKNEWHAFKSLQEIAESKNYIICPKVRLLDIIEPIKGQKKYMTLFYKIQSKHVDFVICDKNIHIKAIIELDDGSHDREDRKERDQFVDEILRSVGYIVIHTRSITSDILDQI